ncbi:UNVERIFIED_CONTAM: hypothetical protein FKN15_017022 [Acipenser sinensis]
MGQVQHGRGGLGLSSAPPTWHKAAPAQRRKLVVNEVQKQEERMRCIKAISQAKQGEWMRWESVEQRKIGCQDLWSMEQSRISFLIRVPSEDAVDEVYERKKLRYAQLAAEAEQRGWRVRVYPVELLYKQV